MAEETFTPEDLAACAEREVKQRERAYPRWIEQRRMNPKTAERQIAMMKAIAAKLRAEANAGKLL